MADFLPYGRQTIEDDDVAAVAEALRSDFLTTGPRVEAFEGAFAEAVGARHAVVCSSGTAALHLAMAALGAGTGDVVIVPAITFAATANCARYQGADVVFADVDADTGLLTPDALGEALARVGDRRLAAVLPVHLAGNAVDLSTVASLIDGAPIVEDACHALGTRVAVGNQHEQVGDGRHGALACFSFHPVKTITTGEGGMVTTPDPALAERLRLFRSHGIERDPARFALARAGPEPWAYEMQALGFNYRLPDVLCALGLSQLGKLERFAARRRALAVDYWRLLARLSPHVRAVAPPAGCDPALHLFTVLVDFATLGQTRAAVMRALAAKGVGSQVHYIPVHRHPYYLALYGEIELPGADAYYDRCLSLPLYPAMADSDPERVVTTLAGVLGL
jgi:UDP-4-amino-4,6-dideoxy-N-acetyl-beta-L-altrosamine transaminase